jgi:hypothetical protein
MGKEANRTGTDIQIDTREQTRREYEGTLEGTEMESPAMTPEEADERHAAPVCASSATPGPRVRCFWNLNQ